MTTICQPWVRSGNYGQNSDGIFLACPDLHVNEAPSCTSEHLTCTLMQSVCGLWQASTQTPVWMPVGMSTQSGTEGAGKYTDARVDASGNVHAEWH